MNWETKFEEACQAADAECDQGRSHQSLDVLCLADVTPKKIDWLWPNWISIGKVSVLAGDGGMGKSTILCDLAARTTTGERWPDGAEGGQLGNVLILAAEDDVEDTLAPRLIAAGANMKRMLTIRAVRNEDQSRRAFNLQADLSRLENEIKQRGDIRLVIIDPVTSYLGRVDSHKNAEVRAVLEPLAEMAARLRVAVICNNHFSKSGGSANNRIIGSVAFVNQARAAFIVTPDAEDATRMLLVPSKMNIAPIKTGLAYRIGGCWINEGEILTSQILWDPTPIAITADEALTAHCGGEDAKTAKAEAIEFLRAALDHGPVSSKDVKKEAGEAGISPKSLRSAREAMGIKPAKSGFAGGWVWQLPPGSLPKMPYEAEDALRAEQGTFGSKRASSRDKDILGSHDHEPTPPASAPIIAPTRPLPGAPDDYPDIPEFLRRAPKQAIPNGNRAPPLGPLSDSLDDLQ
jgi:putative DNA primase/helicase